MDLQKGCIADVTESTRELTAAFFGIAARGARSKNASTLFCSSVAIHSSPLSSGLLSPWTPTSKVTNLALLLRWNWSL